MPSATDADSRFRCFMALGNGWIAKVKQSGGVLDASELFAKIASEDDRLGAVMGAVGVSSHLKRSLALGRPLQLVQLAAVPVVAAWALTRRGVQLHPPLPVEYYYWAWRGCRPP